MIKLMNGLKMQVKELISVDFNAFSNLIKGLKAAYPNFKIIEDEVSFKMWFALLQDIPYERLSAAIQKHIVTSKYPPSIAEIRELAQFKKSVDWSEGWALALSAINRFGSYRESEALDWIKEQDLLAYKVIKRLNFKELCLSEDLMAFRANFRMVYNNEQKIESEEKMIPGPLKNAISELTNQFSLGEGNETGI